MSSNTYTVLLVDDSKIIVERVSALLSEVSCITNVERAASFEEAIIILENHTINVALLDINLPGKNGIELLSFIKQKYPDVKTIMLTNQSDSFYRNLCKRLGSDSFIDKSNEFEKITDKVRRFYSN